VAAYQKMPDGVNVRRIALPQRGERAIRVTLEPLQTVKIHPFIDWALAQLEGLIDRTGDGDMFEIMPSGTVRITFYRQRGDAVNAPLLRQVDREALAGVLQPQYTSELVTTAVYVHRNAGDYHVGTVIHLHHEDGEPFDASLADTIRELDVVQDISFTSEEGREGCLVTMAVPALNDNDGAITAVIKAVAETLRSEYEPRPLEVVDNTYLALLREFDYQPPKKGRRTTSG